MVARAKIDWPRIRDEFVQGVFEGGRHHYPTQGDLAAKHGLKITQVQKQSALAALRGEGSWLEQRQKMEALARARTDTLQADKIAEIRSNFDNHCLVTANAALKKLVRTIMAWEGVDQATQKPRKGAAAEFAAIANALWTIQRAGRLAAGYATENIAWRGQTTIELSEALQAVLGALDPKELSFEQIEAVQQVLTHVADKSAAVGRGREVH